MNISTEFAQHLLTYLGTRPYVEVAPFIAEMQKAYAASKKLVEPVTPEPTSDTDVKE